MPDYKEMYGRLFQSQTQAIEILIKAQQATEEMYMSASEDIAVPLDINSLLRGEFSVILCYFLLKYVSIRVENALSNEKFPRE